MKTRDVIRRLLDLGAVKIRQRGSHMRFRSACGRCVTTVNDCGPRDMPRGTLAAIERDMEPCYGKGWLLG